MSPCAESYLPGFLITQKDLRVPQLPWKYSNKIAIKQTRKEFYLIVKKESDFSEVFATHLNRDLQFSLVPRITYQINQNAGLVQV